MLFGFSIGITLTQAVFLGSPPPFGFGLTPFAVSGLYGTPIVCHSLNLQIKLLTSAYDRSLSSSAN